MSSNHVESRFIKYDHQKSLTKMHQSLLAIRNRKPQPAPEPTFVPVRPKDFAKENEIRNENRKLIMKLLEVKSGSLSILKEVKKNQLSQTDRSLYRPNPFQVREWDRIEKQNLRLSKVITNEKMKKRGVCHL